VSPVTELDLDAIKARAEAATPGPWLREWAFSTHFVVPESARTVAADNVARLKSTQRADANFIAASRTDVPLLVAEVERLTRLLGPPELPSVDSYESMAQALADERAEVVRHCDRIRDLSALLAEILAAFPSPPYRDVEVRSGRVREETLDRWRSRLAGAS
jgi:hypothetical protein